MSTYWHERMEEFRSATDLLPPTHPDGPRRMNPILTPPTVGIGTAIHRAMEQNWHTHVDIRTRTIAVPAPTRAQIQMYTRQLRFMLKAYNRQTSRTPAFMRTNSKAKRAGMRRTRRMMSS